MNRRITGFYLDEARIGSPSFVEIQLPLSRDARRPRNDAWADGVSEGGMSEGGMSEAG